MVAAALKKAEADMSEGGRVLQQLDLVSEELLLQVCFSIMFFFKHQCFLHAQRRSGNV